MDLCPAGTWSPDACIRRSGTWSPASRPRRAPSTMTWRTSTAPACPGTPRTRSSGPGRRSSPACPPRRRSATRPASTCGTSRSPASRARRTHAHRPRSTPSRPPPPALGIRLLSGVRRARAGHRPAPGFPWPGPAGSSRSTACRRPVPQDALRRPARRAVGRNPSRPLIEIDLDSHQQAGHDVVDGSPGESARRHGRRPWSWCQLARPCSNYRAQAQWRRLDIGNDERVD